MTDTKQQAQQRSTLKQCDVGDFVPVRDVEQIPPHQQFIQCPLEKNNAETSLVANLTPLPGEDFPRVRIDEPMTFRRARRWFSNGETADVWQRIS